MDKSRCALVVTTVGSSADAEQIAEALVSERLAACVQSFPVSSVYRWQGELCRETEIRIEAKTGEARAAGLAERLAALHPYDVPEILVTTIGVSPDYGAWVEAETS